MTRSKEIRFLDNGSHDASINPMGPEKQGYIADNLCQRIRDREFTPGEQLPLYKDLEQQYGVSRATLQHAMNRLKREGFIRTAGRRGAFVAEYPPCLYRYGLVLPTAGYEAPGLWRALQEVATDRYQSSKGKRISLYKDVQVHVDNESFQQLWSDVKQHRLAGLIMVGGHGVVFDMDDWFNPGFPGVWFNPQHIHGQSHDSGRLCLAFDNALFRVKALDHLIQQGCRKIAVIGQPYEPLIRAFVGDMALRNLPVREHWLLRTALEQPQCARDLSRLLFSSSDRPDGLVILADNLVEQTLAGIIDAHVQVPDKLKIIAHCNWPLPPTQVLPTQLLGYEAAHILHMAIEMIDAMHQKRPVPTYQAIPPRFEHECRWNQPVGSASHRIG